MIRAHRPLLATASLLLVLTAGAEAAPQDQVPPVPGPEVGPASPPKLHRKGAKDDNTRVPTATTYSVVHPQRVKAVTELAGELRTACSNPAAHTVQDDALRADL